MSTNPTESSHSSWTSSRENGQGAPTDSLTATGKSTFKRGYVACVRCRARKVKCVVDSEPPCAKCRREHRQCLFKSERKSLRHREPPYWTSSEHVSKMRPVNAPDHHASAQKPSQLASPESSTGASDVGGKTTNPRLSLMERAMTNIVPEPETMLDSLFYAAKQRQECNSVTTSDSAASAYRALPEPPVLNQTNDEVHGQIAPRTVSRILCGEVVRLSSIDKETLMLWNKYSLVRQRWFTALEAVTYLDLFFEHLSPLSPILLTEYKDHSTHRTLITDEPLLCSTLLMISSRFFVLPGANGVARSQLIHQKLWQRCARLIEQITFAKGTYPSTRGATLGFIESCLLISDWHPRSANWPSEQAEIDEDLDSNGGDCNMQEDSRTEDHLVRWSEDVLEPSKRSDHMSWMILGTATTLAHKVGLFSDDSTPVPPLSKEESRWVRTRKLLYVYVTNISVRLGCTSTIPQGLMLFTPDTQASNLTSSVHHDWDFFIKSWMELVRLIKTASAMFFESTQHIQEHLANGKYVIFLEHFAPSLERWREGFLAGSENLLLPTLKDLLLIEYHNLRVYTHALSMQAVVERALRQGIRKFEHTQFDVNALCFTDPDHGFLREVVAGSTDILRIATRMALSQKLRYIPARQSLCIISATIFLLKALSIAPSEIDIQPALEVLNNCMAALKASPIDDMDFSSRFASLIEKRVAAFLASFVVPLEEVHESHGVGQHGDASRGRILQTQNLRSKDVLSDGNMTALDGNLSGFLSYGIELCDRPFDPSIAPFGSSGNHGSSGLELDSLDFLWNLPEL